MQSGIVIVFCVGVAITSVNGDSVADIKDILKKTGGILIKYYKNWGNTVSFKELRASLNTLNAETHFYDGPTKDDIYLAIHLGYTAFENYHRAINAIFTWCAKANKIISNYCQDILNLRSDLINTDRNENVLKPMVKILENGEEILTKSDTLLERARDNLEHMQIALGRISYSLVHEKRTVPTIYKSLIDALSNAEGDVAALKDAFNEELDEVSYLRESVQGKKYLLEVFNINEACEELLGLCKELKEFMKKHGEESRHQAIWQY